MCWSRCVSAGLQSESAKKSRVVVGAVSPTPVVVNQRSLVRGQKLTSDLIEEIARKAGDAVDPIEDLRGPADYKRQVVRVWYGVH